jgi:hypothetical protein
MQRQSVSSPFSPVCHVADLDHRSQDLDGALKRACEDLISDSSSRIARPIRTFLDRCTSFLSSPAGKDLPSQEWASSDAVIKLHEDFQATLVPQAKEVVGKLRVYLNDEKTIGVLLPPLLVSWAVPLRPSVVSEGC